MGSDTITSKFTVFIFFRSMILLNVTLTLCLFSCFSSFPSVSSSTSISKSCVSTSTSSEPKIYTYLMWHLVTKFISDNLRSQFGDEICFQCWEMWMCCENLEQFSWCCTEKWLHADITNRLICSRVSLTCNIVYPKIRISRLVILVRINT